MKRRKSAKQRSGVPGVQEDLGAMSRALYGAQEAAGPETQQTQPESIEDPLQDWPESAAQAEHIPRSRTARRDEEREG